MLKTAIVIIIGLLFSFHAKGTEVLSSDIQDFSQISSSISNNCINAFVQDKDGCVWIATERGVNRFNGYDFHYWLHTDNPESLSDNQVKSLAIDALGQVWCGTINGLCRYTDKDTFKEVPLNGSTYVKDIFLSQKGKLIVCTGSSIELLETDEKGEESFTVLADNQDAFCLYTLDSVGRLWQISNGKLKWWNADTGENGESVATYHGWCFNLYSQNGRYLWLNTLWEGLKIFDTFTETFTEVPRAIKNIEKQKGIKKIFSGVDTQILIYTNSLEVYKFLPKLNTISKIEINELTDDAKVGILSTTMTDRDGNLWVGTSDQGFGIHRKTGTQFNRDTELSKTFEVKSVTSLCYAKDDALIINTYGHGLWMWTQGQIKELSIKNFDKNLIQRLTIGSDGYIYATIPYAVARFKRIGERLELVSIWQVPVIQLYDITEDSYGRLWVGTYSDKIYLIDKTSGEVKAIDVGFGHKSSSMAQKVVPLGNGWLATAVLHLGIVLIDENTLERRLVPISDYYDGQLFIPVSSYLESSGNLLIGTRGQGLFLYDVAKEKIEHIQNITAKDIMAVIQDGKQNLWVSSLHGLFKYNRDTDRFIGYYISDGTGGDQYNEAAVTLSSSGLPIFGGTHGITQVNDFNDDPSAKATILFEDVFINNHLSSPYNSKALSGRLSQTKEIRLRQKEDVSVGISFCTVDYNLWPSTHFSYRLEGFENDWVVAGANRNAFYSNLPSGKYRFSVRAWNADYTRIMAEDSIALLVIPPWWLSWWMKWIIYPLLFLVFLFASITIYVRYRKNKADTAEAQRKSENEKRVNDMNMSFFVNVSHEMRTPLSVIKGPLDMLVQDSEISEENHNLLKIMSRNVSRLLRYINQLMDVSKLENDTLALRVRYVDITMLIKNMLDIFKINANEKGVEICTSGLDESLIFLLDDDKVEKILSNLLSNAVKFTGKGGRIEVSLDADNGYIVLSVANNGPEIPEQELEKIFLRYYQVASTGGKLNYGTGIGLYYSRRLAELHHGTIEAHNREDGSGPIFTVRLPISQEAYANDQKWEDGGENSLDLQQESIQETGWVNSDSPSEGKTVILVVEDETEMACFIKTIFSPEYKVVNRYDADSALSDIRAINPDIVICDVMMPGRLDGFDLCRELKNDSDTCHLPVILLTAKVNVESQVKGLDCGADSYITKPFNPSYLKANVRSLLANRNRLHQSLSLATKTREINSDNLSPYDKEFMDRLYELMEKSLSAPELNTMGIAEAMKISRTKLYYKVKALTGDNPNSFFRKYKLNRAAQLLREGRYNISEVADITGFSSLSHFSTSFKKQFGVNPSSYS